MTTQMIVAQCLMAVVLLLMITGKTPLYLTAILGSTVVALGAGFPITGKEGVTLTKLVSSGLIGVIADMTGVLLFIGVLEATGYRSHCALGYPCWNTVWRRSGCHCSRRRFKRHYWHAHRLCSSDRHGCHRLPCSCQNGYGS